ncbi:MAG TPA: ATP-binding protein [Pseudoxanthomonas sp.]|nr:ATP-binding protein [Pseudoxanthomonas sp.]
MLIRLIVPGEEARVEDLNASLEAVLTRHRIDAGLRGDVRLIVEELASNAITHGGADAQGELSVRLTIADGLLSLEFRDDGAPFDPLDAPEPDLDADIMDRDIGGLGLHLIRQLAEELRYERIDGSNLLRIKLRIPTERAT